MNGKEEWAMKRIQGRKAILCIETVMMLICVLCLTGCSETELEERCFPLLTAAGYEDGKVSFAAAFPRSGASGQQNSTTEEIKTSGVKARDFQKAVKEYESHLNKQVDYNHLKVLVLEEDLLQEKDAFNQMLDYLAENEYFPRNTYVCAVDDVEDLFKIEEKLSQDLGTYLEEYISKHEEGKSHILTLGDLLDEKENQTLILYMPYLDIEDDYIEWKGYVNILGEIWQESF